MQGPVDSTFSMNAATTHTNKAESIILGGGVTGLAAGYVSGLPIYEAESYAGGICASYYVQPGLVRRDHVRPNDTDRYRFEVGGGHWIFGGDPTVQAFIDRLAKTSRHERKAGVWFSVEGLYVPSPIQDNLRFLPKDEALKALCEMAKPAGGDGRTMESWLLAGFGPTLCARFFLPFHNLYTAGLHKRIAPQDSYKSPVDLRRAIHGLVGSVPGASYNATYLYPAMGLDALVKEMSAKCVIHYEKRAVRIDLDARRVHFSDATSQPFKFLLCTLPLNTTLELAALATDQSPDPYTSVLVLNIGGKKGARCPDDHWLYLPATRSGFYRVGFYSNVDRGFLPDRKPGAGEDVSIYVERAFVGGTKPTPDEIAKYQRDVVSELQSWGFIQNAEVVDPSWVDVAYTWAMPGSSWKTEAISLLQKHGIYMVGRYARWSFQGIAESIRDGFTAGACFQELK
jgi:protoporphyrinogen oxidase